MQLTEDQERAVRTALLMHPLGVTPKAEDVATYESMAELGVVERVAIDGDERPGFVATDAAVRAMGEYAAMSAASN